MIKLLNKLIANRKKAKRMARNPNGKISSSQIQKMGRFGQQLVVMSH